MYARSAPISGRYARLKLMKLMIFLGIAILGTVGSWLGAVAFDHGNYFGGWSLLLGTVGSLAGVWAGFKAGQYFGF